MSNEPAVLDEGSCRALLRSGSFGRLAFDDGDGIAVLPVNYRLVEEAVVIRTEEGAKLDAARAGAAASLELDAADEPRRSGWSVLVRGHLSEVTDDAEAARLESLVEPLAGGVRDRVVRLSVEQISGRRIPLERGQGADDTPWSGPDATDLMG